MMATPLARKDKPERAPPVGREESNSAVMDPKSISFYDRVTALYSEKVVRY